MEGKVGVVGRVCGSGREVDLSFHIVPRGGWLQEILLVLVLGTRPNVWNDGMIWNGGYG